MKFGNQKKKLNRNIMRLLASGLILSGGMVGFSGTARADAVVEGSTYVDTKNNYYGAYDDADTGGVASGGKVTIKTGPDPVKDVYGGYSQYGLATGNILEMFGGMVNNKVFGGATYNDGDAIGNTLKISGGMISVHVYGGAAVSSPSGRVLWSSIFVTLRPNFRYTVYETP